MNALAVWPAVPASLRGGRARHYRPQGGFGKAIWIEGSAEVTRWRGIRLGPMANRDDARMAQRMKYGESDIREPEKYDLRSRALELLGIGSGRPDATFATGKKMPSVISSKVTVACWSYKRQAGEKVLSTLLPPSCCGRPATDQHC